MKIHYYIENPVHVESQSFTVRYWRDDPKVYQRMNIDAPVPYTWTDKELHEKIISCFPIQFYLRLDLIKEHGSSLDALKDIREVVYDAEYTPRNLNGDLFKKVKAELARRRLFTEEQS